MSTPAQPVRVLPADVYDTLELSALVYGGIGAGATTDAAGFPHCVWGHAYSAERSTIGVISDALSRVMITASRNDVVVRGINRRRKRPTNARIAFAEWCAALCVVRGNR